MYDVKIRAQDATGRDITFAEAVDLASGKLPGGRDTETANVVVTAIVPAPLPDVAPEPGHLIPVSGLFAEVYPCRIKYGHPADAQVSLSDGGSRSPAETMVLARCAMLAAEVAQAAIARRAAL